MTNTIDITAKDIEKLVEEEQVEKEVLIYVALFLVVIAAIGFVIPAIFWGVWYAITGYIPEFMGVSRFWLDAIPGAFYAIILVFYGIAWGDLREELATESGCCCYCEPSFGEFVAECPLFSLMGLVLAIDLVASFFWSFAAGLAAIVIFAIAAGIVVGIYKLVVDWIILLSLVVLCKVFRVFPDTSGGPIR